MPEHDNNDRIVWLLLLERGRQTGDFELAARAKRELERLGIRVTYTRLTKEASREPATQR